MLTKIYISKHLNLGQNIVICTRDKQNRNDIDIHRTEKLAPTEEDIGISWQ